MFIKYYLKNYHKLKKQLSPTIIIRYLIAGGLVAIIYYLILNLLVNFNVNYSIFATVYFDFIDHQQFDPLNLEIK